MSGNRSFKVELIPKGNATGQADGRSQQIATNIATGGECTTTIETTGLRTSSGSGEASLRKLSSATGKLALSFRGPSEQGRSSTSGRATYSNSKCGSNQTLPESAQPTDPNLQGEPPVVRVHVDWELVFGGGT